MGFLNLLPTAHCCTNLITPSADIKDLLSKETPGDRLKRMYSVNEFGFSPEIRFVITAGYSSTLMAAIYGGSKAIFHEQKEYIRKNLASTYDSEYLAKRNLSDKMTLAGINGAFKYGLKYGGFSTIYLLSAFSISNYRDKITPWEHTVSFAVIGGMARINYGIKGMLVSGILGGFLGFFSGSVITLGMKFSGLTMEDFRCWVHQDYYLKRRKTSPPKPEE